MARNGSSANGGASGGKDGKAEDLRLPLLRLTSQHPCHGCGDCCRYVAVEIDKPTSNRDFENVVWYLSHRDVIVYQDFEHAWFIEFQTRCEHLTDSATCGIYTERPQICSEFSWEDCERNSKEPACRYRFSAPEEFVAWLRKHRPRSFERYMKFRAELIERRKRSRLPPAPATPPRS
jgi:Fe-S-cluster containining protein